MRSANICHLLTCLALLSIAACQPLKEDKTKVDLGVSPMDDANADSAAYQNTIGSMAYYEGLAGMQVRGYGLVVGLGKNGSTDCPPKIYEKLVQAIHKQQRATARRVSDRTIAPERLINDVDTAVVIVQGVIPPAAVKGSTFDVAVVALPGTQTKSLVGGRLYTAELEVVQMTAAGPVAGQMLARASGPVYVAPVPEGGAKEPNPLAGVVLGGGTVAEDRRVRLVLSQPSYNFARRIQDRINAHFPAKEKIAVAESPSYVQLRVPEEFRADTTHFLSLVRALYMTRDPAFEEKRAQELGKELVQANAQHGEIALCFEGLGRRALPVLNELYSSPTDHVSFHAAAAGIRLGDHVAADAMALHALDANCAYRSQAIRALGAARGMAGAAASLRRLLDDPDANVRIAAFDELARRKDSAVTSIALDGDGFVLDIAPSKQGNVIHAKQTDARRIALIGNGIRCRPPFLYRAPDGVLMLDAKESDKAVSVLRSLPSGRMAPPATGPLDVAKLVTLLGDEAGEGRDREVTGLGVDYGGVVRALYALCKDQAINAQFVLEPEVGADLRNEQTPSARPESEL